MQSTGLLINLSHSPIAYIQKERVALPVKPSAAGVALHQGERLLVALSKRLG